MCDKNDNNKWWLILDMKNDSVSRVGIKSEGTDDDERETICDRMVVWKFWKPSWELLFILNNLPLLIFNEFDLL